MTSIYLIRHAECEMNLKFDLVGGRSNDSPLTRIGVIQSMMLYNRFRMEGIEFDEVYSSPALRTMRTQEISYRNKRVIIREDLQELHQGDWMGRKRAEVYTPEAKERINLDNWNFAPPNGESQKDVGQRMLKEVNRMVKDRNDKGCIGVYTHGGAIRYLLAGLDLIPKKDAWKVPIDNTSITELEYLDGIYKLIRLNDAQHLSLNEKDLEKRKIEFMNFLLTSSCS